MRLSLLVILFIVGCSLQVDDESCCFSDVECEAVAMIQQEATFLGEGGSP